MLSGQIHSFNPIHSIVLCNCLKFKSIARNIKCSNYCSFQILFVSHVTLVLSFRIQIFLQMILNIRALFKHDINNSNPHFVVVVLFLHSTKNNRIFQHYSWVIFSGEIKLFMCFCFEARDIRAGSQWSCWFSL